MFSGLHGVILALDLPRYSCARICRYGLVLDHPQEPGIIANNDPVVCQVRSNRADLDVRTIVVCVVRNPVCLQIKGNDVVGVSEPGRGIAEVQLVGKREKPRRTHV